MKKTSYAVDRIHPSVRLREGHKTGSYRRSTSRRLFENSKMLADRLTYMPNIDDWRAWIIAEFVAEYESNEDYSLQEVRQLGENFADSWFSDYVEGGDFDDVYRHLDNKFDRGIILGAIQNY